MNGGEPETNALVWTMAGAVIGFYFGNRGTTSSNAETLPSDAQSTSGGSEKPDKNPSSN